MSDIPFLIEQLRKGYDNDPWHGSSTTDLLEGLSAEEAASHPVPEAHSVWEIVLHMIAWQNEVRRRLTGRTPAMPEEGDWPRVADVSEAAWRRDQERLGASLDAVLETLASLSEKELDKAGGSLSDAEREPALGTGVTFRGMVLGLLQHNSYHGGQIGLLRKALAR